MPGPPSEGLELAERGGGGRVEALRMTVFFPKRPQSWETRPAAACRRDGQDKGQAGCEVPWRQPEPAPGCVPGPPCSPGPSEDGEMRWDLPRGTEGP